MLHGIDPLLTADLLHALRAMGHGDTITIVDANFPAATCARRLVAVPGIEAGVLFRAVLSVLPIDDFIPRPMLTMQVVGEPDSVPPAVAELREIATTAGIDAARMGTTDRHAFYSIARESFVIVQTGDRRLYANVIATKGVLHV